MGDIDISIKSLVKLNSVFAQLFGQGVYNGKVRIDPDKLEELDTAAQEIDRFEGDLKAFLLLLKDRFDREKMKSVVAMHKETWYAVSKIKNNKKYMEYIDSVSDEDLAGGVSMDAAWDYIEEIGKVKGEAKVNKLGLLLEEAGRTNDFMRSLSDMKLQKQLFVEFGIEQEN